MGLILEELNLDKNLETKLKADIGFLKRELEVLRRRYKKSFDNKYYDSLTTIIDNINKINDYKVDSVYNLLSRDKLSAKFLEIGKILYEVKEYNAIRNQLIDLVKVLEELPKIKFTKKAQPLKRFVIDYFFMFGLLVIVVLAISIIAFPQHQILLSTFLGAFLALWLIRMFGKQE